MEKGLEDRIKILIDLVCKGSKYEFTCGWIKDTIVKSRKGGYRTNIYFEDGFTFYPHGLEIVNENGPLMKHPPGYKEKNDLYRLPRKIKLDKGNFIAIIDEEAVKVFSSKLEYQFTYAYKINESEKEENYRPGDTDGMFWSQHHGKYFYYYEGMQD